MSQSQSLWASEKCVSGASRRRLSFTSLQCFPTATRNRCHASQSSGRRAILDLERTSIFASLAPTLRSLSIIQATARHQSESAATLRYGANHGSSKASRSLRFRLLSAIVVW
jgi:hypothetical protein